MDLLRILDGTPEPQIIDLHLKQLNTSGDYDLPTPMYEFQKELTDQIVSLHYPDILRFCETDTANDSITKSLEICYQNCILVSIHPYLLINHYMPKNLILKDILSKLAETSGKFNVLKDLVNVILASCTKMDKSIGIVMHNGGKVFDLVEALLLGCAGGNSKVIKRYVGNNVKKESKGKIAAAAGTYNSDKNGTSSTTGSNGTNGNGHSGPGRKRNGITSIHLIPSEEEQVTRDKEVLDGVDFDLILIFDSQVEHKSAFVERLRTQNKTEGRQKLSRCPMIKLVPLKTIEHVQLHYYGQDKSTKTYLDNVISAIVCLREQIGILQPDLFPIYNQNLKYLGHEFFDKVFEPKGAEFPAWPLPELPPIPYFNAADVERSLLTEVHYHYTPYDTVGDSQASSSNSNLYNPSSFNDKSGTSNHSKIEKPTYYETKKIEQNYVTNPNKNDFNMLSGITPIGPASNEVALTHKLIMRMNTTFLRWKLVEQEHEWYSKTRKFTEGDDTTVESEVRESIITRLSSTKKTLSSIVSEVQHAKSRISSAEKRFQKQTIEIEAVKVNITLLESSLANILSDFNISSSKLTLFYENQLKIWSLQQEIKESLDKINSKKEEKSYIQNEYQNATKSIEEFKDQIEFLSSENDSLKRKIHEVEIQQEDKLVEFKKQRESVVKQLEPEKERNQQLMARLGKSWKFLKNTSHLKKRKGRGITPNR